MSKRILEDFSGMISSSESSVQKKFLPILKELKNEKDEDYLLHGLLQVGIQLKSGHCDIPARALLTRLSQEDIPEEVRQKAAREYAAMAGFGSSAMRLEHLGSRLFGESVRGGAILPMLGATVIGQVAGMAVLGKLGRAVASPWSRGIGAQLVSEGVALSAELPVFVGLTRALSPENLPLSEEVGRMALDLGVFRVFNRLGSAAANLGLIRPASLLSHSPLFLGLLATHHLRAGLKPALKDATTTVDALGGVTELLIGSTLGNRLLGRPWAALRSEMEIRTASVTMPGELRSEVNRPLAQVAKVNGPSAFPTKTDTLGGVKTNIFAISNQGGNTGGVGKGPTTDKISIETPTAQAAELKEPSAEISPVPERRFGIAIKNIPWRDKLTRYGQISPPFIIGAQWLLNGHPTGLGFLGAFGVGALSMAFSRGGFNTGVLEALGSWFWFRLRSVGELHCWGDPYYGWRNSKLITEEMSWLGKNRIRASEVPAVARMKVLRKAAKQNKIDLELYLSRALKNADPAELEAGLRLLFKDNYYAKAQFIARHQLAAGTVFLDELLKTTARAPYTTDWNILETLKMRIVFDGVEPYFADLEKIAMMEDCPTREPFLAAQILFQAGQRERALPHILRSMKEGDIEAARLLDANGYREEVSSHFLEQMNRGELSTEGARLLGENGYREVIPEIRRLLKKQGTYDFEKVELLVLLGKLGEKSKAIQKASRLKEKRYQSKVWSALGEIDRAAELAAEILHEALPAIRKNSFHVDYQSVHTALGVLGNPQAAAHLALVREFAQEKKFPYGRLSAAKALIALKYVDEAKKVLKDLIREKDVAVDAGFLLDQIDEGWDYFIPGSQATTLTTAYRGRIAAPLRGLPAAGKVRIAGEKGDSFGEHEAGAGEEVKNVSTKVVERKDR